MSHSQPPKTLETSLISPAHGTVLSTTLPLTFFDVPFLSFAPAEILLFYSYPITTDRFLKEFLPKLKQSLSITLQHFFPYASNLIIPPRPALPYLRYVDGEEDSSLLFIIAESLRHDFDYLIADSPKDSKVLDDFIPKLPPPHVSPQGFHILPIMAIQVTIFPGYGISIGNVFSHVVGDGVSFHNFMNFWMSMSNQSNVGDQTILLPKLPPHSFRNAIKDPGEVANGYLEDFWSQNSGNRSRDLSQENMVRATFLMRRNQMDNLKRRIRDQVSTFEITLALTWVSLIKTLLMEDDKTEEAKNIDKDESLQLLFPIDCRTRLKCDESLPSNYVGNCTAPRFVSVKKRDMAGENGVLAALNAIRACNKEVISSDIVKTAPTWRHNKHKWLESRFPIAVTGGSRLGLYDLDFGLGKPCKLEIMHNRLSGKIAISESRDGSNGVEIGLVLNKTQMESFASTLQHEINTLSAPCLYPRL